MATSPVLTARGRLGRASSSQDTDRITEARRDLAAAKIEQYINKVVAAAPPLTSEQRSRLAALLRYGGVAK